MSAYASALREAGRSCGMVVFTTSKTSPTDPSCHLSVNGSPMSGGANPSPSSPVP